MEPNPTAYEIHCGGDSDDSNEGKNDFDDNYYENLPPPYKYEDIRPRVVIVKGTNAGNSNIEDNTGLKSQRIDNDLIVFSKKQKEHLSKLTEDFIEQKSNFIKKIKLYIKHNQMRNLQNSEPVVIFTTNELIKIGQAYFEIFIKSNGGNCINEEKNLNELLKSVSRKRNINFNMFFDISFGPLKFLSNNLDKEEKFDAILNELSKAARLVFGQNVELSSDQGAFLRKLYKLKNTDQLTEDQISNIIWHSLVFYLEGFEEKKKEESILEEFYFMECFSLYSDYSQKTGYCIGENVIPEELDRILTLYFLKRLQESIQIKYNNFVSFSKHQIRTLQFYYIQYFKMNIRKNCNEFNNDQKLHMNNLVYEFVTKAEFETSSEDFMTNQLQNQLHEEVFIFYVLHGTCPEVGDISKKAPTLIPDIVEGFNRYIKLNFPEFVGLNGIHYGEILKILIQFAATNIVSQGFRIFTCEQMKRVKMFLEEAGKNLYKVEKYFFFSKSLQNKILELFPNLEKKIINFELLENIISTAMEHCLKENFPLIKIENNIKENLLRIILNNFESYFNMLSGFKLNKEVSEKLAEEIIELYVENQSVSVLNQINLKNKFWDPVTINSFTTLSDLLEKDVLDMELEKYCLKFIQNTYELMKKEIDFYLSEIHLKRIGEMLKTYCMKNYSFSLKCDLSEDDIRCLNAELLQFIAEGLRKKYLSETKIVY